MRQSIIIPNRFEKIFMSEAEKSGLIKPLYNYADEIFDGNALKESKQYFQRLLDNKKHERQSLFRILMLFDDIILPYATSDYDYDKLSSTGLFSFYYFEDYYQTDFMHQEGHIQYAEQLKSAILPVFEKDVKPYFKFGQVIGGYSNFISDLYDCILLQKPFPEKYNSFVQLNKEQFDILNRPRIKELESMFGPMPKTLTSKRFFSDIVSLLQVLYESLCWQLKISSDNDAAIWNCEFQLSNIGCQDYYSDVDNGLEAYRILRMECGKIIGTLPEVNSIQEVIHLKEKRHRDLHNLRQELSRLEYEIRNGNSQKAIEKAANDITKASNALSKGLVVSEVTKWTNIFSIPIGVVSLCMEQPQIALCSGALSIIGNAARAVESSIKENNKWFEILI